MTKSLKNVVIGVLMSFIAACMIFAFSGKTVVKAADVLNLPSFNTRNSAEIRIEEPYGIRFTTEISVSDYNKLPDNAVFGTLVIPTQLLDGDLTLSTENVLDIETRVWKQDGATKYYNGVLVGAGKTNFDEKYYSVPVSACGYVTYTDEDDITHTIYTANVAERSVVQVAALALKAGKNNAIMTAMVNSVVSEISFASGETVYLAKGDTVTATVNGANSLPVVFAKSGDISLSSETANTVLITADEVGAATLTATLGSRTATLNVVVKDYAISSDISSIRGIVGDAHTITTTVTDGGEEVSTGSVTYSANEAQATIVGNSITPLVAGNIDVTVTYTDVNGVTASKVYTLSANTVSGYLAAGFSGNKLVNWNDTLYSRMVSDSTVSGYSMSKESYEPSVVVNYQYKLVPAQSGRNITFPIQNVYTDGYLKIDIAKNSGTFPYYEYVYVLKYGETDLNNYVVKATGATGDILDTGNNVGYIYVPVSMLTNAEGVLEGVQLILFGGSWYNIRHIDYVPAGDYTPTYSATTNLSSISLRQGGGAQTVTASISAYCGAAIGAGLNYSVSVTSSDTSVATVSGTTLTPVAGGDTTVTVTFSDNNGNILTTEQQVIHVTSFAEQVAATLGENEFVNWTSTVQVSEFLSDTTVAAYAGKEKSAQHHPSYKCYQFYSSDNTYVGHNIEFAKKEVYTEGYIKLGLLTQRGGTGAFIYKYGATADEPVYTVAASAFTSNTRIEVYVPISDLVNESGVLEGIQIVMNAYTGTAYYYTFEYATAQDVVAATLGTNELVNWKSDAQLDLVENAVVSGYTGTLTNTVINRVAAGYYNYQFNSSNNSTGRVQIEFANQNKYTEGYVKIGLLLQSGWGQTSFIYKYGETANNPVYTFTTSNAERNTRIYHYIPVANLVNEDGILEGIQVVLILGSSYGQIYDISYVTEIPA